METKYVDLHKLASIFRGIQEEEYPNSDVAKELEAPEVAHEVAIEEDNAFNTAAAKAAIAGSTDFEFNGKKYPVKMSKEEAQKLLDSEQTDEPVVTELDPMSGTDEPTPEAVPEDATADVLQKGMEDAMLDKVEDAVDDEPCEECGEAPCDCSVEEADVELTTSALAQILKMAGMKPVTDTDINQPVEEYSNSPDEEYADTDTQLNKMSGGINRPKAMPTVGNQGHNELVMKLKKAYSDIE